MSGHVMGWALILGCRWAWALTQALSLIIVGLLNLRSALISFSFPEWSV